MLPLVSNDAVAILFMFDLTRKATLNSVKEWYRQARGFNKTAIPVLIGTKYDKFAALSREEQEEITKQAKRFAKAMHAPLVRRTSYVADYRSSAPPRTRSTCRKSSRLCSQRPLTSK